MITYASETATYLEYPSETVLQMQLMCKSFSDSLQSSDYPGFTEAIDRLSVTLDIEQLLNLISEKSKTLSVSHSGRMHSFTHLAILSHEMLDAIPFTILRYNQRNSDTLLARFPGGLFTVPSFQVLYEAKSRPYLPRSLNHLYVINASARDDSNDVSADVSKKFIDGTTVTSTFDTTTVSSFKSKIETSALILNKVESNLGISLSLEIRDD